MQDRHKDFTDGTSPLSAALQQDADRALDRVADAVRTRRMRLAYQPVIIAADPRKLGFHEGLIRILDPGDRQIPARDFIHAVEPHALGREIDVIALAIALESLARHPELRLSINMSARSVGWPRWQKVLHRGLRRHPHLGQRLILEFSETSAMTVPELLAGFMAELRPKGISFALDGFGAGAFALRHFRELDFDVLKIDPHFTRAIHANPDNQVLMGTFLALARQLDMLTVAQGVETAQEAAWLTALGIDCLQGYHFGAPKLIPDQPGT
jgi:EAL domain-containing protein (putative c-di-GMP-specific phosphodiesterase class I)